MMFHFFYCSPSFPHFPTSAFFRARQCLALLGLMTIHARQISQTYIRTFTQPTSFIIVTIQTNVHLLSAVYDTSFCCFVYLLRHLHQPVSYLIQLRFVHTFLFYFFKSALSRLHYISIHHTIFFYLLSHSCGFSFGPFLSSFFRTNGQQLDNYMPIIGSYLYSFLCLDYVYFRCSCTLMYLIKK